uniref:Uncharacterized protein n=1 Tax=Pararge aegeria TaxID=116150 RepID=S4NRP8_9NEOP
MTVFSLFVIKINCDDFYRTYSVFQKYLCYCVQVMEVRAGIRTRSPESKVELLPTGLAPLLPKILCIPTN